MRAVACVPLYDGSTPVGSTSEQFTAHIKSEIAKWRKLIKEAKISVESLP